MFIPSSQEKLHKKKIDDYVDLFFFSFYPQPFICVYINSRAMTQLFLSSIHTHVLTLQKKKKKEIPTARSLSTHTIIIIIIIFFIINYNKK